MEQNQFKPFDKVLVRDDDTFPWYADLYSHYDNEDKYKHKCIGSNYRQCIPYNEDTAHLIGTYESYKEPEPKVWHVAGGNIEGIELFAELYSDNELKKFLEDNSLQKKYKWIHIAHVE